MCTALTLDAPKHLFGRNLDLAASFGQLAICVPKDAPIQFSRKKAASHYAMLGIGAKLGDLPLFAEAINSEGLAMAGLNFPGNAYFKAPDGRTNEVGQGELIAYVLCFCKDLGEAKELLSSISLCDIRVEPNTPCAPLHYILADSTGCFVFEQTVDGAHIYDDPFGVLTNNPEFPFMQRYMDMFLNLTSSSPENRFSPRLGLKSFGLGMGAIGLPGDNSGPSRLVRASFARENSSFASEQEEIVGFFHILDNVKVVEGTANDGDSKEKTVYSSCYDLDAFCLYCKTYGDPTIRKMEGKENGEEMISSPLSDKPDFPSLI